MIICFAHKGSIFSSYWNYQSIHTKKEENIFFFHRLPQNDEPSTGDKKISSIKFHFVIFLIRFIVDLLAVLWMFIVLYEFHSAIYIQQ